MEYFSSNVYPTIRPPKTTSFWFFKKSQELTSIEPLYATNGSASCLRFIGTFSRNGFNKLFSCSYIYEGSDLT